MAYEQKTKETENSVLEFIALVGHPAKEADAHRLLHIFSEATGFPGKMWGTSIIGFGSYHYKYASGHEGDAALVGFSPRKAKISLYLAPDDPARDTLLPQLGKYTAGKACVYIQKLSDIRIDILQQLIQQSVAHVQAMHPASSGQIE